MQNSKDHKSLLKSRLDENTPKNSFSAVKPKFIRKST